ncbi:MAG: MBL fold metallo-hydrolase, partial [Aestuariivirga sp.]|nr:MBL fold metallo-hydrolase [Aestuariivirga sp.]
MAKLKVLIIPVTPFQQNCSLVFNEENRRGAIVDPGGDVQTILMAIEQSQVRVEKILLTHGHIDHAGLLPRLWKSGFAGPVFMTRGTRDLL